MDISLYKGNMKSLLYYLESHFSEDSEVFTVPKAQKPQGKKNS